MKLNATSEMIPVTWPEFGAIHPFAPLDQVIFPPILIISRLKAITTCLIDLPALYVRSLDFLPSHYNQTPELKENTPDF